MFRTTAAAAKSVPNMSRFVDSVVVGGGPGGLAVVGNLLEQRPKQTQLWVDPFFKAGRVGAKYREVPSNTKVGLFLDFATAVAPFKEIVDSTKEPNAVSALRSLPQDQGCELEHAANLCLMLTEGVNKRFDNVHQHQGRVTNAVYDKEAGLWTVLLDKERVQTSRIVFCTGSAPITDGQLVTKKLPPKLKQVHLDVALKPSELAKTVDPDETIAVVGASHSAILVLMNLYNLAVTTHPKLRIKWFTRHKDLRYAEYKDGWILYDNTGLKGQAAEWARNNLDEEQFGNRAVSQVITKIWTPPDTEDAIYESELPGCTRYVQAIGYQKTPLPGLRTIERSDAQPANLIAAHDDTNGRFYNVGGEHRHGPGRQYIPGMFGAGIAYPERVTDPAGNVEHAVGFWKFMKFLKRTVPQWVESSN